MTQPLDPRDVISGFQRLDTQSLAWLASAPDTALLGVSYSSHLLMLREGVVEITGEHHTPLASLERDHRVWRTSGDSSPHETMEPPDWLTEVAVHNGDAAMRLSKIWHSLARNWWDYLSVELVDVLDARTASEFESHAGRMPWTIPPELPERFLEQLSERLNQIRRELSATAQRAEAFTRDLDWEHDRLWDAIAARFSGNVDWHAAELELGEQAD